MNTTCRRPVSIEAKRNWKNLLFDTQDIPALVPGFLLAVVIMLIAFGITKVLGNLFPSEKNPLSPILMAILLGLLVRNTIPLHQTFDPGIRFGLKKLLRLGIILMGIRLSIFAVLKIGALAVGMVLICIVAALLITTFIARKIGISDKLGTLIAAGTSICGVSAIVATGPTIQAEEEEIAYAVGTITIFGILAAMAYPYLAELVLRLSVTGAGFFLGTSVHDTSQVTATALIYDQLWQKVTPGGLTGTDIAITTKLVRNTFMVVVIPVLGFLYARKNPQQKAGQKIQVMKFIPVFVFGYVAMGIIRSLGDLAFGESTVWIHCWQFMKSSATHVIAIAIACVGLNTNIRKLTQLGIRPFLCGLIAALSVGGVSWLLVTQFDRLLRF